MPELLLALLLLVQLPWEQGHFSLGGTELHNTKDELEKEAGRF